MLNLELDKEIVKLPHKKLFKIDNTVYKNILLNNNILWTINIEKKLLKGLKELKFLILHTQENLFQLNLPEDSDDPQELIEAYDYWKNTSKLIFVKILTVDFKKYLYLYDSFNWESLNKMFNYEGVMTIPTYIDPISYANSNNTWDNLDIYGKLNIIPTYEEIRLNLAKNAAFYIKNLKEKEIALIDIGTGTGESLHTVVQYLGPEILVKYAIGIDLNEKNIQQAKQKFTSPNYKFKVANTLTFTLNIKELNLDPCYKVVISSGGLNRNVLNSTLEAVYFIQQALRQQIDLIMLNGYTEPLLTKKLVGKVGWASQKNSFSYSLASKTKETNILVAPRHSVLPLFKDFVKKIFNVKENMLDLSLHGDPLSVLQSFPPQTLATIIILDLSLAYLENADKELNEIIKLCSQLQSIYVCGIELWLDPLKNLVNISNRNIKIIEEPWRHLFSKKNAEFSQEDLKQCINYNNDSDDEDENITVKKQDNTVNFNKGPTSEEELLKIIARLEIKPFSFKFYEYCKNNIFKLDIQQLASIVHTKVNEENSCYQLVIPQKASKTAPFIERRYIWNFLLILMQLAFQKRDNIALYLIAFTLPLGGIPFYEYIEPNTLKLHKYSIMTKWQEYAKKYLGMIYTNLESHPNNNSFFSTPLYGNKDVKDQVNYIYDNNLTLDTLDSFAEITEEEYIRFIYINRNR